MKPGQPMFTPRKILFAVALVLLCCALLNSRWTSWLSRPVHGFVHTTQRPAGWVVATFKPEATVQFSDATLEELKFRLEKAKKYNEELWQENRQLKEQIKTFEVIAEIRDLKSVRLVEAKVSRFNDDKINPTITVLRGSLHGVKKDDPVVYRFNMLGFVESVGPANSVVTLVTKPDYRTEVTIMPPNQDRMENNWPVFARAESNGKGGFTCDLSKDITKALRPGDIVRVSDRLRESANGFILGAIEKIQKHPDRPLQLDRITILPRTAIGEQGMVTVLTERKD